MDAAGTGADLPGGSVNQTVLDCIYAAVDEIGYEVSDEGPKIEKAMESPLQGSGLDSLDLVNFVAIVEENVEEALSVPLTLYDERTLDIQPSPLESIGTLVRHIEALLEEEDGHELAGDHP